MAVASDHHMHIPVVVGYDFTQSAQLALHRAVTLAASAPRHVLHVVCAIDPHEPIPSIPSDDGVDYLYAGRVQEALAASVKEELGRTDCPNPVTFFVHARIGQPTDEILALANEVGADLIIVGNKGTTGLERLVVGSVSEKIVRHAGCNVEIARVKQYADVELLVIKDHEPHLTYVPPHRYDYAKPNRVEIYQGDFPHSP